MKKLRTLLCAGATALLVTAVAAPSSAQQSDAMAEAMFRQARELMKGGNYEQACPKFAESQRLDPKLGTLLNLAVCHDKQGKVASAWAEFSTAASMARREGRADREKFANDQMKLIEAKLPQLVLKPQVTSADMQVTIDGRMINAVMFNSPLPVDPGTHSVTAKAAGKREWSTTVEVPAGKGETPLLIPPLEDEPVATSDPAPPVAPTTPAPAPAPASEPKPAEADGGGDYTWLAATGFAVGGVGIVVGAITGGMTLSKGSDISDTCNGDSCPADQADAISEANTLANVSNVGFAIGGVGLVVGVIALLISGDDSSEAATLSPRLGPGGADLRWRF
jgi:hypothetical protein